ncbi:hypothetical protein BST96_17095 [Oceanicoccus sagamiensis]|uniref:Lytic murein transglycosylase n=1 Tax=Oceanicoccus sagamiensis TaxID=716816 RepID=A0A1X9NH33_9GAMM|nr:hypothetical protein BST96_17095 [Oceanicoccus sagamiensis]
MLLLLGFKPTLFASSPNSSSQDQQAQQQLFKQTLAAIKKGHKTRTDKGLKALADYPLYPYLLQAQLKRDLRKLPYQEVDQFLTDHGNSVSGKQLRKSWLKTLAQKKQWPEYIRYFDHKVSNNELKCWHIEAMHQTGHQQLALNQTAAIWVSGKSQPDACDPVFKRWQQAGLNTDALTWQRINLALANNNTLLARYLSKRASPELKPYTRRLISVHRSPTRLKKTSDFKPANPYNTDIIYHGLKRLAPRDRHLATDLWIDYRGSVDFSAEQHSAIRDKIARQVIASGKDNALQWLITHDPNAEDSYLMEWRIRIALRQQQWSQADHWITLLPEDLRASSRWRYWQARTWQLQDKHHEASQFILQQLAGERNYYGFLAADLIQQRYGFNHSDLPSGPLQLPVDQAPEVIRAQQFYQMGELISARREWYAATQTFDQDQLLAATNIAHQWGWHQQAINTTIKANHWNDLSVRFPLAYQNNMIDSAKLTTINPEWLYAIARQESAFAHDAYSSAGARGLMQLRPATAKQVAKRIGVPHRKTDLFRAEHNITLGSNYLKHLLDDFEGNRILATAAYNAGPHRVRKWLKNQTETLPHDIWIETLPFHETRNYVQNVLAFSVIYGHRLGIESPLIAEQELFIVVKKSG